MNFKSLFTRRKSAPRESAPLLTPFERRSLAFPMSSELPVRDMMRDTMIQTAIMIKRRAVAAAEFRIEPADGTPEAVRRAAFVEEAFARMEGSPLGILDAALEALVHGWSVQEMVYRPEGDRISLEAARPKNPDSFGLDLDEFGKLRGLLLHVPGEPERRLSPGQFVVYRYRANHDQPRGQSDLEAPHPHWRAKQRLLGAWRSHLERFAMPTVIGKVPRGSLPEEAARLNDAIGELHNQFGIVLPADFELGLLGGNRESISGFLDAIEFHNREMARSILGQTLTTDEGRRVGSLALGKVHLQVLLLQISALRRELADTVMTEQVIRPLVELNFGPGQVPRFVFDQPSPESFVTGRVA